MKQFLKILAKFLVFSVIAAFISMIVAYQFQIIENSLFGKETNFGETNLRSSDWTEIDKSTIDLIVLGPSTAYRGIDPGAFQSYGISAFNFGSSSQQLTTSSLLLSSILSESSPKILLLDIMPEGWSNQDKGRESALDWIINSNLRTSIWRRAYLRMALATHDPFTLLTTLYFNAIRQLKPAGENFWIHSNQFDTYHGFGFVSSSAQPADKIDCTVQNISLHSRTISALEEMKNICKERSIQLILVNPPQLCEEEFEIPTVVIGLTFIDGNDWPGAKKVSNYYDEHHLVGDGARDYSAWLAREIAELK